jgi:hypothetical protein
MNATCRSANLRTLLQDEKTKEIISELVEAYNKMATEDIRGTRLSDLQNPSATVRVVGEKRGKALLDLPSYHALQTLLNRMAGEESYEIDVGKVKRGQFLLRRNVTVFRKVFISGVYYASTMTSERDSNIAFRTGRGDMEEFETGQIARIFVFPQAVENGHSRQEIFLEVRRFKKLDDMDAKSDDYRKFGFAGGYLCYNCFHQIPSIVEPSQVISHVAKTSPFTIPNIATECVHILLLDQVSCEVWVQWICETILT